MNHVSRIEGPSFLDAPELRIVFAALDGQGEELRVVGGAIRNHLMGVAVHEIDLTTTALPETIIARASAAGLKCVPTGLEHGTVTLVVNHVPFEVTTLRVDVETDGRRAKVAFGRDFRADALRRDFTFNALSVSADGSIHDYAQGARDIAHRHVLFIGDPDQRIREDYLRILRFFRFHAAFGQGPADPQALAAIARQRSGLDGLSRERVRAELLKLLVTQGAAETLSLMAGLGLTLPLLGSVTMPLRLERIIAIETARGSTADAILRLAALALLKPEDAQDLRARLRLSNAEYAKLAQAAKAGVALHGARTPPDAKALRQLIYRLGTSAMADALDLAHAESDAPGDDPHWTAAHRFVCETAVPKLPFSGADFVARGIPAGKAVGEALQRAEKAWIEADFPDDRAQIDPLIASALRPLRES